MGGSVKKESDFKGNQIVELALSHSSLLKKKKMIAGLESKCLRGWRATIKAHPTPHHPPSPLRGLMRRFFNREDGETDFTIG